MKTKNSTTVQSFVNRVLAKLNKSEKEIQEEQIVNTIEDYKIECETQIQMYKTSEIPKAKLELKKAENELVKAQKNYEETRFSINGNFQSYIQKRNKALDIITACENNIYNIKRDIKTLEEQLHLFEEVLCDFNS